MGQGTRHGEMGQEEEGWLYVVYVHHSIVPHVNMLHILCNTQYRSENITLQIKTDQ